MVLMRRALADKERGLGGLKVSVDPPALAFLSTISDGDGRKALNALEVAVLTTPKSKDGSVHITLTLPLNPSRKNRLIMTGMGTPILIQLQLLLNPCVVQTRMQPFTGWPR